MKYSNRTICFSATAALLCLGPTACALKSPPDHSELVRQSLGDAAPPAQWRGGATLPGPVAGDWLKTLNEPQLDSLVGDTLEDQRVSWAAVVLVVVHPRQARRLRLA